MATIKCLFLNVRSAVLLDRWQSVMLEFLRMYCATSYTVPAPKQSFGCVAKMLFFREEGWCSSPVWIQADSTDFEIEILYWAV